MHSGSAFGSRTRKNAFLTITFVVFAGFTARLTQLQLVEGSKYRSRSEAQGIKQNVIEPIRGAIYDRYNHAIVANVPSYSVLVTPNRLTPHTKAILARFQAIEQIVTDFGDDIVRLGSGQAPRDRGEIAVDQIHLIDPCR